MTLADICEILDRKRRQRICYLRRVVTLNAEIEDLQKKQKEMERQTPTDTRRWSYPAIKIKEILKKFKN